MLAEYKSENNIKFNELYKKRQFQYSIENPYFHFLYVFYLCQRNSYFNNFASLFSKYMRLLEFDISNFNLIILNEDYNYDKKIPTLNDPQFAIPQSFLEPKQILKNDKQDLIVPMSQHFYESYLELSPFDISSFQPILNETENFVSQAPVHPLNHFLVSQEILQISKTQETIIQEINKRTELMMDNNEISIGVPDLDDIQSSQPFKVPSQVVNTIETDHLVHQNDENEITANVNHIKNRLLNNLLTQQQFYEFNKLLDLEQSQIANFSDFNDNLQTNLFQTQPFCVYEFDTNYENLINNKINNSVVKLTTTIDADAIVSEAANVEIENLNREKQKDHESVLVPGTIEEKLTKQPVISEQKQTFNSIEQADTCDQTVPNQNVNKNKVKKRKFMIVGLSKRQRISNHLHTPK